MILNMVYILTDESTDSVYVFFMVACMHVHACVDILKIPSTSGFDTGSPSSLELFKQARLAGQQTSCLFFISPVLGYQPSHLEISFFSKCVLGLLR